MGTSSGRGIRRRYEKRKRGNGSSYTYSSGGFVGIGNLTKGEGPKWVPHKKKQQTEDEEKNENVSADTEMFILGLLKEQRQEEKDRQRMELISETSVACASDKKDLEKFER